MAALYLLAHCTHKYDGTPTIRIQFFTVNVWPERVVVARAEVAREAAARVVEREAAGRVAAGREAEERAVEERAKARVAVARVVERVGVRREAVGRAAGRAAEERVAEERAGGGEGGGKGDGLLSLIIFCAAVGPLNRPTSGPAKDSWCTGRLRRQPLNPYRKALLSKTYACAFLQVGLP